jgi:hypothetical protein
VAPRLNVVSAPMGTGKTTFTTAFIVAMVRLSDENPQSPYGCLFLTDQIVKAEAMYRELAALLPGKVAIWTSDHGSPRKSLSATQWLSSHTPFSRARALTRPELFAGDERLRTALSPSLTSRCRT